MNKNIILYIDPLFGNITIQDIIDYFKLLKNRNDELIDRLYTIIKNLDCYDEQDITTIFNEDISSSLQFVIDLLEDNI